MCCEHRWNGYSDARRLNRDYLEVPLLPRLKLRAALCLDERELQDSLGPTRLPIHKIISSSPA